MYAWVLVSAFIAKFLLLWFINLEKLEIGGMLMNYPGYVYFILIFLVSGGNICFFLVSSFKDPGYSEKNCGRLSVGAI